MKGKIAVLVTTSYKGVFYGYMDREDMAKDIITLYSAHNVISWSSDVNGFLGLTNKGPSKSCRISAKAGGPFQVRSITSITECSKESSEKFDSYE